ncbi:MAG: hypothetical protein ACTSSI_14790 [Candidatus Helarchaeota archaeon]
MKEEIQVPKSPTTINEIIEIVKQANEMRTPIFTHDTEKTGIYLDRSNFNKIHVIDEKNLFAVIDWSVTFDQLKKILDLKDLTIQYPLSSSSDNILECYSNLTPILSNARHRASQVSTLQIVLPDGRLYRTGASSLVEKNYWREDGGPNINRLFLSSNEIFGIIVRGTIFLYPKIERRLVGLESDDLEALISLTKEIIRRGHGEEIIILNNESMKNRFQEQISRKWCLVISFNQKYFKSEWSFISKSIDSMERIIKRDLNHLIEYFERNWRDLPNNDKIAFHALMSDIVMLQDLLSNYLDPCVCEIVPVESGRSVYIQSFSKNGKSSKQELLRNLIQSRKAIFSEINSETIEILNENPVYFEQLKKFKKMIDPNNILNPKKWLGVAENE